MKTSVAACMLSLTFLSATFADTLVSLDPGTKIITVTSAAGLKSYHLKDPVEVRVDGVAGQAEQLKAEMQVTLGFADPRTVNKITASTVIAKSPIGLSTSGNAQRRITLKARVDGKDLIKVKDGKLTIEHKAWSKPTDISVNGRNWKTQWNGDSSDEFIKFVPPLAPFTVASVEVRKVKGRGSATLKQAPSTDNGQTLIVEINDGTESGADNYEVRITW